jgi:signal peptidase I
MFHSALILFSLFSLFLVEDVSMEPRLFEGDRIIVLKTKNIKSGKMGVVRSPEGVLSVKTCFLNEGDSIVIEGNFLIAEERKLFLQPYQRDFFSGYTRVPEDKYFFAGENSFHSRDSRDWGFLEKKDIIGRVIVVRRMNR